MSWSSSSIICLAGVKFQTWKGIHLFQCLWKDQDHFLNAAQKDQGFINKQLIKIFCHLLFISSLFHLICLCCYLTAPFSKENCQNGKISIKQSVTLPPYRPSSLILLHVSLAVPAFCNKRRWMSLILLCCIVISIIHGTDRAVLGEWVTAEWGGNEYS